MGSRSNLVITTPESMAIKDLRIKSSLSVRKLAGKMKISPTYVHQLETGRANITEEYIEKFLSAAEICQEDWDKMMGRKPQELGLRERCIELLLKTKEDKLELIYGLLVSL